MKIKNTQPGPRGINTVNGPVLIEAGETRDGLSVFAREQEHIEASGWFEVEGEYTADPAPAGAATAQVADTSEIDRLKADLAARDAELAKLKQAGNGGQGSSGNDTPTPSYTVKEQSAGWFAVVDTDGKALTKNVRKDAVDGFADLDADKQKAFVEANKAD